MATRTFLPNSPALMNAGRRLGMLSACFVLPLGGSIEEIMETARQIALVQRAGGGTGIDLSALRPKGSIVRSSGGTTDGPLSFLKMLSGVTDAIQQGAFRRGANMGVMRVDHPDILAFINVKSDATHLANYNLSVAITNDFMESLKPRPNQPHAVVNPHTGQQGVLFTETGVADYDAEPQEGDRAYYTVGEVWQEIVQRAWLSVGQLARRWGVSPQRIHQIIEDGNLPGAFRIPASGRYRACLKIPLHTVLEAEAQWAVTPPEAVSKRLHRRKPKSDALPMLNHFPELSQNHEPAAGCRADEEH